MPLRPSPARGAFVRRFASLAVLVTLAAAPAAAGAAARAAGPMDFLFTIGTPPAAELAPGFERAWKVAEYSAVRLVTGEPGAPRQHPARVDAERLRALLASVEFATGPGRHVPLFAADEAAELAPAIGRALAGAAAGDDVLVLSTSRRDRGFLTTPLSVAARVFVDAGRLQLIVGDTRLDALSALRAARVVPQPSFGSRARDSNVVLRSATAVATRGDWLAFDLVPVVAAAASPLPASPAAGQAPAAGTRTRDANFYDEQAQRLRGLQRLREQGLLSEDEFQQKRRDILQSL